MGKVLAKPLLRIVGKAVKEVGKDAANAAKKAALEHINRPLFSTSVSAMFLQDAHGKAMEAADIALHEIPYDIPKVQARSLVSAVAKAASHASYTSIHAKTEIATKDIAEETAAGAASEAAAKHAFHAVVRREQIEEKAYLKTNMGVDDIEGVRYTQKEKESQHHQEVIDFIKDFLSTTETFKEDILLNIKEGTISPKFDICTNGLFKIETQMKVLQTWIHSHQYKSIQPEAATLSGELHHIEQFLEPLIAGMGNLQRLAMTRQLQNTREFTDPQLDSLRQCLAKVNTSFEILAGYMLGKKSVSGHELESFPINISEKSVFHLETFL